MLTVLLFLTNGSWESFNKPKDEIAKLEWKAVFVEGPYHHFYLTVDEEIDYYAGYYYPGDSFEFNENSYVSDAPENALSTLSTMLTQIGNWYYIYPKSDVELAVMTHPVIYPQWYIDSVKEAIGNEAYTEEYETYHEVLTIPITKGSQVQISDSITVVRPTESP